MPHKHTPPVVKPAPVFNAQGTSVNGAHRISTPNLSSAHHNKHAPTKREPSVSPVSKRSRRGYVRSVGASADGRSVSGEARHRCGAQRSGVRRARGEVSIELRGAQHTIRDAQITRGGDNREPLRSQARKNKRKTRQRRHTTANLIRRGEPFHRGAPPHWDCVPHSRARTRRPAFMNSVLARMMLACTENSSGCITHNAKSACQHPGMGAQTHIHAFACRTVP